LLPADDGKPPDQSDQSYGDLNVVQFFMGKTHGLGKYVFLRFPDLLPFFENIGKISIPRVCDASSVRA
jgi:hypothetical protein